MVAVGGYVRLYRKIRQSDIWRLRPEYRLLAIECLLRAEWRGPDRGSFDISLGEFARETGLTKRQIRRGLEALRLRHYIGTIPGTISTRITVVNYDSYQDSRTIEARLRPDSGPIEARLPLELPGIVGENTPEEERRKKKEERTQYVPKPPSRADVGRRVLDYFNQKFSRRLTYKGYAKRIESLLAKGYSVDDLKGVIWYTRLEWSSELHSSITPTTLFKLSSSNGKGTFPEYLSQAEEKWIEINPNKPCPWSKAGR
jgi:uncharacterized phage protein (TIGR02220 family)